tara:strand:+ start:414 stop:611 length:198 start_codon:yes stop_codon:yes gene_type:complete
MSSSRKNDGKKKDDEEECEDLRSNQYYTDDYDESWDEWYDESVIHNKKSKLRRSKKRLYKNRDEW